MKELYVLSQNNITVVITLEGVEKKKKCQQNSVKNVSFTNVVRKRQETL